jgi:hypothetical protein
MASSDSAARRLSKLKPLKALGMDGMCKNCRQQLIYRGSSYGR